MKEKKRIKLFEKFGIKELSFWTQYGKGFIDGLLLAEKYYKRIFKENQLVFLEKDRNFKNRHLLYERQSK